MALSCLCVRLLKVAIITTLVCMHYRIYAGRGHAKRKIDTVLVGESMGCGLTMVDGTRTVYFTKNGQKVRFIVLYCIIFHPT